MKLLKDLLYKCPIIRFIGNNDIPIEAISFDSRNIPASAVFVAIKGTSSDGHTYINQVIDKGVSAIVCEKLPVTIKSDVCYVLVKDSNEALGVMACNFYNSPSNKLRLIGITGTNGKTTTATLLYEIFTLLGYKVGLISTVRNIVNERIYTSTHTTPDPIAINALLSEMVIEGCEYCFMEVSSHAIVQKRIAGLQFVGGIFSNLTHDHLDFHKTFDAYIIAKKHFFDTLNVNAYALINIDDKNGYVMVQNTKAKIKTMALKKMADFHCKILESGFDGLFLNINGQEVWTHLVGSFNAYNLLAIYAITSLEGIDSIEALVALSKLKPVDGRFEYFKSTEGIIAIVDYAHTPDALKNVLDTIQSIRVSNGKLITVIGAGGDRDKLKRPIMASIASSNSDLIILTSDNPRTENPQVILDEMSAGVSIEKKKKCLTIPDRLQAIKTAYTLAQKDDVILVAGKGHENYQEINGIRHHFDDREIIRELFQKQETGNK